MWQIFLLDVAPGSSMRSLNYFSVVSLSDLTVIFLFKHQLDLEALKWEMRSPGTPESFVCPAGTTDAYKRKPDDNDVKQGNDNSYVYQ